MLGVVPSAPGAAAEFRLPAPSLVDIGVTGNPDAESVLGVVPSAPGAAAEFRLPAPSLVDIGVTGSPDAVEAPIATDADRGVAGRF